MDNLIIAVAKGTCGLALPGGWVCVHESTALNGSPFNEDGYYLFTTGLLLTVALVMPLGFFELVDTVAVLIISFFVLVAVSIQWIVAFCQEGLKTELIPTVGSSAQLVLGIIIFNFSYVTNIPTWVHSLKPGVSIHKCLAYALSINTAIYLALGILGAFAFPMQASDNILTILSTKSTIASQVTSFIFPVCALITSIPVVVIIVRSNLIRGGLCGKRWGAFWSNIVPWLICIPLINKNSMNYIQNWTSLFFQSTVNFILPFVLFFVSRRKPQTNKGDIKQLENQDTEVAAITTKDQVEDRKYCYPENDLVSQCDKQQDSSNESHKSNPNSSPTELSFHTTIITSTDPNNYSSDSDQKSGQSTTLSWIQSLFYKRPHSAPSKKASNDNNDGDTESVAVTMGENVENSDDDNRQQEKQHNEEEKRFMAFKQRSWLKPIFIAVMASCLLGLSVIFMIVYDIIMVATGNDVLS
ncbi:hypothetical protein BDA99DRAFT_562712 [Phascolomyces articulosus]|uniref:Amino acid transporter transmembrane domain-containing protein n=1 Tax=Phascolomyces articulosus TaxID=60185 RepID=A0AAD5PAV6_9FUNG|nr:hypothetical protein BDA99DRAFT_562712 [Phascolomyces articulosus]